MAIGHVVSGLRPPRANWWCPAKEDSTLVADCCVVAELRLNPPPPPPVADCHAVGELRLNPPKPHTDTHTHTHCPVLRVLRGAFGCSSAFDVVPLARVALSRRCLRSRLRSRNVHVACCANTPLFENAISHESLRGCTPPRGLCSTHHAWSPAQPNQTSRCNRASALAPWVLLVLVFGDHFR